jgi:hypothetical protein
MYTKRTELEKELKDFSWVEIRAKVQCQSLREQTEHLRNRIAQIKRLEIEKPYIGDDYKEKLANLR